MKIHCICSVSNQEKFHCILFCLISDLYTEERRGGGAGGGEYFLFSYF